MNALEYNQLVYGGKKPNLPFLGGGGGKTPSSGGSTTGGTSSASYPPASAYVPGSGYGGTHAGSAAYGPSFPFYPPSPIGNVVPTALISAVLNPMDVAAYTGTLAGLALPGAAAYSADLYNPGFNAAEMNYLNLLNQQRMEDLGRASAANLARYGQTPFHSGALLSENDLARQSFRDLLTSASTLQLARQERAAQQLQNVFNLPYQMAQGAASGLQNLINLLEYATEGAGATSLSARDAFNQQLPYVAPAYVASGSSGGGKK
jgi:hypothetical protein